MAQVEHSSASTQEAPSSPVGPEYASRASKRPPRPASVKINVEGAFIVNDETVTRNGGSEFVKWEQKDIRLPHHTDVVSHIAVDVSLLLWCSASTYSC